MHTTKVFSELLEAYVNPAIRIIVLRGGTRSGKTWAILMFLIYMGRKSTRKRLISVVSESLPHLRKGAIRDFENILETELSADRNWHDTNKAYSFGKAVMEFFSADTEGKVTGPAREVLYINECINIAHAIYRHLAVRTTEKIILDYNPAFEFWVDEKIIPRKDVVVIDSTYLDNDMLTAAQISEIESNRETDPDWWKVYGLGLKGNKEGLVVQNWDIVQDMVQHFKAEYIGVDFGWSAPTAVMHIRLSEGEVWIDELLYGPNITNKDIADAIAAAGLAHVETICDGAEPKSIADLVGYGIVNAVATKNKEIALGIQVMNRYKKHYTQRSLNSIQENRQYRYPKDIDGKYGSVPIKAHGHAKDAERYVFLNRLSNIATGFSVSITSTKRKKK